LKALKGLIEKYIPDVTEPEQQVQSGSENLDLSKKVILQCLNKFTTAKRNNNPDL